MGAESRLVGWITEHPHAALEEAIRNEGRRFVSLSNQDMGVGRCSHVAEIALSPRNSGRWVVEQMGSMGRDRVESL